MDEYIPPGLNGRLVVDSESGVLLWRTRDTLVCRYSWDPETGLVDHTTGTDVTGREADVLSPAAREAWANDRAWADARVGGDDVDRYLLLPTVERPHPLIVDHSDLLWLNGANLCSAPIEHGMVWWSRAQQIDWANVDEFRARYYRAEHLLRAHTTGFWALDERLVYVSADLRTERVTVAEVVEAYEGGHPPVPGQAREITVPGLPPAERSAPRMSAAQHAIAEHLATLGYRPLTTSQILRALRYARAYLWNSEASVIRHDATGDDTWTAGGYDDSQRRVAFFWRGDPAAIERRTELGGRPTADVEVTGALDLAAHLVRGCLAQATEVTVDIVGSAACASPRRARIVQLAWPGGKIPIAAEDATERARPRWRGLALADAARLIADLLTRRPAPVPHDWQQLATSTDGQRWRVPLPPGTERSKPKPASWIEYMAAPEQDWWSCPCGNNPRITGLFPCDEDGWEIEPTAEWTGLLVCPECGRVADGTTYDPVHRRVRVVDGIHLSGLGELVDQAEHAVIVAPPASASTPESVEAVPVHQGWRCACGNRGDWFRFVNCDQVGRNAQEPGHPHPWAGELVRCDKCAAVFLNTSAVRYEIIGYAAADPGPDQQPAHHPAIQRAAHLAVSSEERGD